MNSKVQRGRRTGEIVGMESYTFSAEKLTNVPDLFRLTGFPHHYFANERLVSWWQQDKCDNLYVTEMDVLLMLFG